MTRRWPLLILFVAFIFAMTTLDSNVGDDTAFLFLPFLAGIALGALLMWFFIAPSVSRPTRT